MQNETDTHQIAQEMRDYTEAHPLDPIKAFRLTDIKEAMRPYGRDLVWNGVKYNVCLTCLSTETAEKTMDMPHDDRHRLYMLSLSRDSGPMPKDEEVKELVEIFLPQNSMRMPDSAGFGRSCKYVAKELVPVEI